MPRRPLGIVLATLLLALLQTTLPAALSIIDARLEAESRSERAAVHIEREGARDCPRAHVDECGVCQFLSHSFGKREPEFRSAAAPRRIQPFVASVARQAATSPAALPPTRAPPVV